ncbi:MAG: ABC transporter ATP-binding protein [Gemmatimonadota bacterium]
MSSLRSLLPYFRRYRGRLALGLLFVVAGNVFQLAGPQFLGRGIDALAAGAAHSRIAWLAAGLIIAALLTGAARFGMRRLLNGVSRLIEYDLRNDLYRHLETLPPAFYHRVPTGDLMARATNDLGAVRMVAGPAIMYLHETLTRMAMAIPLMARIDWRLTGLGLVPMLGMPLVMVALGGRIHRRFEEIQEHFSTMTTFAHENLSGVRVVRAYRQEGAQTRRFEALNAEYFRRNMRLAWTYGALFPMISLLGGLGGVITLGFGGLLVMRGAVSLGDYVAFWTYVVLLIWPMVALGWVVNLFQRGAASMGRIQQILAEQPTVADPPSPRTLPPATGGRTIEFRDVWFRYPAPKPGDGAPAEARGWALQAISFVAPAGARVAVVGATGAGKSTLVELIPRLADPDRGEILADGVPVRELRLADLRRVIGFVPQETFLFSQTIAENVGLGEMEPGTLEAAARVAQLHETVTGFPAGYETMLGERGINLSGGQKQRATLARALARDPDVVVLDDALSAVDTETEAAILRGLREALSGRTTLVVSHRITAVRDADLIVVLDDGRIVEQGRHEDLFAKRGRYWELLRRQQLEESLEAVG